MNNNNMQYNSGYNQEYEHMNSNFNNFGLRDKADQGSGLSQHNPKDVQFTTLEHNLVVDTRDCIGTNSLQVAQLYSQFEGKLPGISGNITSTTGLGVTPIVVTFDSVTNLRNGDTLTIKKVRGNTNANGIHKISTIDFILNTAVINIGPNGDYLGGGSWVREADNGYPKITDKDSIIVDNVITVNLESSLKFIKSLTLFHIVIPRDIIPLNYILSDFIASSVRITDKSYPGIIDSIYTTLIRQEASYMEERIIGFYSTPLDMWRTYIDTSFSLPDQVTPPPLELWNPPGPGAWPWQPLPYPFQTVPTYMSNKFLINAAAHCIILGGHGVYDLVDWTIVTGTPAVDALRTSIIRKLLLILICPIQSFGGVNYIDLILTSSTTSNLDPVAAYGFGDYQRYVPGPGIGLNYQPNTNAAYTAAAGSGPPNVTQVDSFIPFPNFRGNVWGPYNNPKDRFQKLGVRSTVQDLYLNGDLNNLFGSPIILPDVPSEGISLDPSYGLNFSAQISVNLSNLSNTTNLNILNAMRITPNGFGAVVVRAEGGGLLYTSVYNSTAGGIGPSPLGTPSAWVNNGIYTPGGSYMDPIAQGSAGPNLTAVTADATTVGTTTPLYNTSYNDFGSGNGRFVSNINNYVGYTVNDLPDTDLIIKVEEALRNERSQSTRSINSDAILDVPIRLNLGSTSGTFQYIESLQSLLAQATAYWNKRYLNTKASIDKLHISLFDYEGRSIPLEKMLQPRGSSEALQRFVKINEDIDIDFTIENFSTFSFLFDPFNPQLIGRVKRYLQIIFKVELYHGIPPGLEPNTYSPLGVTVSGQQNYT